MTLYLHVAVADFVSTARGAGERWRCEDDLMAKVNLNQFLDSLWNSLVQI
jgi:hypothetical protein